MKKKADELSIFFYIQEPVSLENRMPAGKRIAGICQHKFIEENFRHPFFKFKFKAVLYFIERDKCIGLIGEKWGAELYRINFLFCEFCYAILLVKILCLPLAVKRMH